MQFSFCQLKRLERNGILRKDVVRQLAFAVCGQIVFI